MTPTCAPAIRRGAGIRSSAPRTPCHSYGYVDPSGNPRPEHLLRSDPILRRRFLVGGALGRTTRQRPALLMLRGLVR
jgi:hypothetical protein